MSVRKAAALYRRFREREPKTARKVRIKLPRAVMVMGFCDAISYRTTHGNKAVRYKHSFAPGCRPLLCAGTGSGQLFLIEGRYRVTYRGIVDLSPVKHAEIED